MKQTSAMKISAAAAALLVLGGGALLFGGVFEDDEPRERARTVLEATGDAPGLAGHEARETIDADAGGGGDAPDAEDAARTTAIGETDVKRAEAAAADGGGAAAGTEKPAVRRSPFGIPRPKPGTKRHLPGGRRGGMGGPTGHWTRFPPRPPAPGKARLVATVLDEKGAPVPNADVYLGPPDVAGVKGVSFGDIRKLGKTDAKGVFRGDALPAGSAAVMGNFNNQLNGRWGLDARHAVTTVLRENQSIDVKLTLPLTVGATGTVAGRVLDPDGEPLSSAQVYTGFSRVWTKADGGFEIEGVPEGEQKLWVSATGYGSRSPPVTVKAGATVRMDVKLAYEETGTASLAGVVVGPEGEPIAGGRVYLMIKADRGTNRRAVTDAHGRFEMKDLPDRVRTEALRVQAGKTPQYTAKVLEYESGLTEATVRMELPARFIELGLTVKDAQTGEDVAGCRIEAFRPESRYRKKAYIGRSRTQGLYTGSVEPGRHRVVIEALDYEKIEVEIDVVGEAYEFRHTAKLNPKGERSAEVNLTVVLLASGTDTPITHCRIELLDAPGGEALSRFEGRREGGVFLMPAWSGSRGLRVSAEGHETVEMALPLARDEPEVEYKVHLRPR